MLLKLVLDTNTIISAFFWKGNEAELFRKIEQGNNKFFECAQNAKADYIISGDKDLLSLKEYNGIPMTRTQKILQLL